MFLLCIKCHIHPLMFRQRKRIFLWFYCVIKAEPFLSIINTKLSTTNNIYDLSHMITNQSYSIIPNICHIMSAIIRRVVHNNTVQTIEMIIVQRQFLWQNNAVMKEGRPMLLSLINMIIEVQSKNSRTSLEHDPLLTCAGFVTIHTAIILSQTLLCEEPPYERGQVNVLVHR